MTQPEQEAREMLAAEWGDHPQWQDVRANILDGSCSIHSDTVNLANSIATRALTKALSRPTAGIDREVARMREIANDWRRPELVQVEGPNDLKIYGGTIADDIDRWARMLEGPTPAKTGERGAVIEEYSVDDVRRAARASIEAPGCSHNVYARTIGVTSAKLSEFLSGKRGAEPSIIEPMGYRWVLVNTNDYPYPCSYPEYDEETIYDREGPR